MTALLSDEDYGEFQSRLAANPGLGALIKGGSGIRRIRVGLVRAASVGVPASFTTPEERVGRSDPEAGGAARQGSQGGVQG